MTPGTTPTSHECSAVSSSAIVVTTPHSSWRAPPLASRGVQPGLEAQVVEGMGSDTLLVTGVHEEGVPREAHLALIQIELTEDDVAKFIDSPEVQPRRPRPMSRTAFALACCCKRPSHRSGAEHAGLVLLDDAGEIKSATPRALSWLGPLDDRRLDGSVVVHEVAAQARALADGDVLGPPAVARAQAVTGEWLLVRRARLEVDGRHTAVVLEPASRSDIAPLISRGSGCRARPALSGVRQAPLDLCRSWFASHGQHGTPTSPGLAADEAPPWHQHRGCRAVPAPTAPEQVRRPTRPPGAPACPGSGPCSRR